ncbi:hypothetical protein PIB30_114472, partial [Stylosanthes scabra]|nr:hypothetical protein [Stylosanthes scabra]
LGWADVTSRRGTLIGIWHRRDRTSRTTGKFINTCHFQVTIIILEGFPTAITNRILEGDRSRLKVA